MRPTSHGPPMSPRLRPDRARTSSSVANQEYPASAAIPSPLGLTEPSDGHRPRTGRPSHASTRARARTSCSRAYLRPTEPGSARRASTASRARCRPAAAGFGGSRACSSPRGGPGRARAAPAGLTPERRARGPSRPPCTLPPCDGARAAPGAGAAPRTRTTRGSTTPRCRRSRPASKRSPASWRPLSSPQAGNHAKLDGLPWKKFWRSHAASCAAAGALDLAVNEVPAAGLRLARALVAALPDGAQLVLGSSNPVRDVALAAAPREGLVVRVETGVSPGSTAPCPQRWARRSPTRARPSRCSAT